MIRILFVFLVISPLLFAFTEKGDTLDTDSYIYVDSISIIGNFQTESDIIFRELTFKTGDSINIETLKFNKDRIYSLGLFNQVNLYVAPVLNKNIIMIAVIETWYIWPIPFIELVDRDWSKVSYGIDLSIKNFRGQNQNLRVKFALGFDPYLLLSYSVPYLYRKEQIFLNWSGYYGKIKNRNKEADTLFGDNYSQRYIYTTLAIGKRISLYQRVTLSGMFEYISTPQSPVNKNFPERLIARIPSVSVGFSHDSRDLVQFPTNGLYISAIYTYKGFNIDSVNYSVISVDYRHYFELFNDISIKWRLATRQVSGQNIHLIDYSYLGLQERIRGNFSKYMGGNELYVSSVELKYPLIKEWNLNFNFPIIPKALQSYRVALYYQLFFDAGTVRKRGEPVTFNSLAAGYGGGLTFLILPYNLARLEMAMNTLGKLEYIFDLGISF